MFHGSVPQDMQRILRQVVSTWTSTDIYVGCSGNFTVERVLADLPFRLHSNDVTIYSVILGRYFAHQPFRLDLKDQFRGEFGWLQPYLTTNADKVAVLMLSTKLAPMLTSAGEVKADHPYYRRLIEGLRQQWDGLHVKTREKIAAASLSLESFAAADVVDWIDTVLADAAFITYPPFRGAERAYQNDFSKVDLLFEWDRPTFQPFDDARRQHMIERMIDRREWAFGINATYEALAPNLRGITQTTNRGLQIYIYASQGKRQVVMPRQDTAPVLVPRLTIGDVVGDKMTLILLSSAQFQALRSQYMNQFIRPGAETQAYGVLVDGRLIGCFAVSTAPTPAAYSDISSIYLLSDFPVAPSSYPRLSKLVLYAALSREAKFLYERVANHRIRTVSTTAFANKPVSMKYRGLFDLYSRKELHLDQEAWAADIDPAKNPYYAQKYQLQYKADVGAWSLDEGLKLWKAKHGERHENQSHQD